MSETIPFACDYSEGMFANQDRQDTPFAATWELEATCHHEAAHAVVMYGFGQSIESLKVVATYGGDGRSVAYSGLAQPAGGPKVRIDYRYRPSLFRLGVAMAAGPAGERRYRHERDAAMKMLLATAGDHQSIDTIAKSLEVRGRDRFAYQRLVWRAALRLVSKDEVWSAVQEIAEALFDEMICAEEEAQVQTAQIEPRRVHAICRRHGVQRGAFRPTHRHHLSIF